VACLKVPCRYSPVRLKTTIENLSYDYLVTQPGFEQLPPKDNSVPPSNSIGNSERVARNTDLDGSV
jgi:hypothetical protein